MKKGFTLAEVLITMAIIGVIAAVTLPALNVNIHENASITQYKKALSTLNNIGSIVAANDGFNYSDLATGAIGDDTRGNVNGQLRRQVWAVFDKYAKLDRRLTNARVLPGQNQGNTACDSGDTVGAIYFKDGSVFCYYEVQSPENGLNMIIGVIDVNGTKSPNRPSTCTNANCNNREIADQFAVTLAGEEAFPGWLASITENMVPTYMDSTLNNASRWASEQ